MPYPSPASLTGGRTGPLLIIGSGADLWTDLEAAGDAEWPGARMAVNLTALLYPRPFEHWACLHSLVHWFHPDAVWWRRLPQMRGAKPLTLHGSLLGKRSLIAERPLQDPIVEWPFPTALRNGCSGLFAVWVALQMGYDPIVLAGVPQDKSGNVWGGPDTQGGPTHGDEVRVRCWERAVEDLKMRGRVFSVSGVTRELLGPPLRKAA